MWDTTFDESMLNTCKNLIVHCPSEELVESLMEIFERNGVRWCGGESPTMTHTNWDENGIDTCYWVESKKLSYSERQYADEDPDGEYGEYVRCTFYGVETPDFETATDSELRSLLGV